jgi:hypothetical protein
LQVRQNITLDGVWQFAPDDGAQGLAERPQDGAAAFGQTINVPGCWQAQGV